MKDILALSDRQLQEVTAAAASLRVESRDQFLRDIASQLAPLKRQPTDADVAAAINQRLASRRSTCATARKEFPMQRYPHRHRHDDDDDIVAD